MKNILLILTLTYITNTFAYMPEGLHAWRNESKKIFNVYLEPQVQVEVEKLNAGEDDFYAAMTVKTLPSKVTEKQIERAARGYEVKYISKDLEDQEAILNFQSGQQFRFEILNSPNGPIVDASMFLTKKQYLEIKRYPNFELNYSIRVTPLISNTIEQREIDPSTCETLQENGNKVPQVMAKYSKIVELIKSLNVKHDSIKKDLLKQVQEKCFKSKSYFIDSFAELAETELEINAYAIRIFSKVYQDVYEKRIVEHRLKGEI